MHDTVPEGNRVFNEVCSSSTLVQPGATRAVAGSQGSAPGTSRTRVTLQSSVSIVPEADLMTTEDADDKRCF